MKIHTIKEVILGPRQMTFGFDDDVKKEQDLVVSSIIKQFETHGHVVLDEFVAAAEALLDLTQAQILQYIFWSAQELKIQFRVDGRNLPPFETKQALLTSPEKCVELITNQPVEDLIFQGVLDFYQKIFKGENPGDFSDQYDFSRSLLWNLKRWETHLESFAPIAQKPFYPGSKKINDSLHLLKTILSRQDPHSLILSCHEHKEKIAALADDIKIISEFYTRQVKFWDLLIPSMKKFSVNLTEIKENNEIFLQFNRLNKIIETPAPYDLITEAQMLLKQVQIHNDLIGEKKTSTRRTEAVSKLDAMIEALMKLFSRYNTNEDLKNKFLYALRHEKKKLAHMKTIRQIDRVLHNTQDLFDDFVEELEEK